jgi:hypothetical protein
VRASVRARVCVCVCGGGGYLSLRGADSEIFDDCLSKKLDRRPSRRPRADRTVKCKHEIHLASHVIVAGENSGDDRGGGMGRERRGVNNEGVESW